MHQKIRRGLLGTLFAGGLLALGATAANADTTATGTVTVAPDIRVSGPHCFGVVGPAGWPNAVEYSSSRCSC